MKKIGSLMAANGKYQKDGQEKTSWFRCGTLFENNGKYVVKLDGVPVGTQFEGWLQVFPDKPPHEAAGDTHRQQARSTAGLSPDRYEEGPPW